MGKEEQEYEDSVRRLQSEAMADLEEAMAKAGGRKSRREDPVKAERTLLIMALIRARHKRRLTQAQLADRLGMRQSAIARIESGRGNPGLNALLKIAKALGVALVLE